MIGDLPYDRSPPKIEIKEFLLFERSLDCITGEKIFNITFASTTNDKTLALTNFLSQPKHHLKGAVWIYTGDSSLGILMFYSDRMKWFRGFFGTQEEAFSWGRPTSSCAALMDVRYQTLPEPSHATPDISFCVAFCQYRLFISVITLSSCTEAGNSFHLSVIQIRIDRHNSHTTTP